MLTSFVKSSVPLYAQLEAALRESIRRGVWEAGTPLPSDRELASQWRVSRCTVRQALDALVREGLVERRQGKGTFVVPPGVLRDFIGFYSFGGLEGEPMHLTSRILSFEPVDPSPKVREHLRVIQGVQVMRLRLLRLANGEPALLLTSYLPLDECSNLAAEDFITFPVLTEAIASRCGIPIVSQRRSIRATLIEADDAEPLGAEPGTLGLQMERISFTDFRRPVEYGYTVMRGDQCAYVLDVGRTGGRTSHVIDRPAGRSGEQASK